MTLAIVTVLSAMSLSAQEYAQRDVIVPNVIEPTISLELDVDQDGDSDIITSGSTFGDLVWFENDGTRQFSDPILIGDELAELTHLALESGDYSVEVTIEFPCAEMSSSVFVLVTSLEEITDNDVLLFPNPMTDMAILEMDGIVDDVLIEIFDLNGKLVRSRVNSPVGGLLSIPRGRLVAGH